MLQRESQRLGLRGNERLRLPLVHVARNRDVVPGSHPRTGKQGGLRAGFGRLDAALRIGPPAHQELAVQLDDLALEFGSGTQAPGTRRPGQIRQSDLAPGIAQVGHALEIAMVDEAERQTARNGLVSLAGYLPVCRLHSRLGRVLSADAARTGQQDD